MRTFVIGDIHGCSKALRTIVDEIDPVSDDKIIFLGDYIDRGPDSRNVIDQILRLRDVCEIVTLRGNHEIMLSDVVEGLMEDQMWLGNGGGATVASYGGSVSRIPEQHLEFFRKLEPFHETADSIYVHANYDPLRAMVEQEDRIAYWTHLNASIPGPHCSGKRVYVGHTPQADGEIWDLGYLVCLDTYCFGGGYLTAYQTETAEVIQADRHGHLRRAPLAHLAERLKTLRQRSRAWFNKRSSDSDDH